MTRGWCPSLTTPMAAADGLLVRLRPRFGWLDAAAAALVAEAAERFGNGLIDLTHRGNLQLRGLSEASVAGCAALLDRLDFGPGRPNLLTPPLLGLDPAECPGTLGLAGRIAEALAARPAVLGPAEKLCVAIDGGGRCGPPGGDLMVREDAGGWWVDGVWYDAEAVPGAVAAWCDRAALVLAAGGRRLVWAAAECPPPIGFLPYGSDLGGFGIGLVFGAMDAGVLRQLARLAGAFGDGSLRLTGARSVVLTGVAGRDVARLCAAAADHVVALEDPRRAVEACVGKGFCAAATTDTRADALALAAAGVSAHVSGCAKGCAHPAAASVTLVGREGRYDLVRQGRAGDAPVATGMSLGTVISRLQAVVPA